MIREVPREAGYYCPNCGEHVQFTHQRPGHAVYVSANDHFQIVGFWKAEAERLRSIHHEKCSIATGDSDVCDCQLNAGRVWLAKAYNGAALRAERLLKHLMHIHGNVSVFECGECGLRIERGPESMEVAP